MTTVLISGLGLIGSSIARIIKDGDAAVTILGSDPDDENADFLLEHQMIDSRVAFTDGAKNADVIILAGPVSVILDQIGELSQLSLKDGVLVTDVGSTKQAIMTAATRLTQKGVAFMGGHPMAGSHLTGSQNGTVNLFKNAKYFLVTGSQTERQLRDFQKLLKSANVDWITTSAQTHDKLVSELSHVPHAVAAALVNSIAEGLADDPVGLKAAAGGFKSTTRIAASDPQMWTAIMMSNSEVISSELASFQQQLSQLEQAIKSQDEAAIYATFAKAQKTRQSLDD
ncbi:prephenate dehydrogenase [Lentilactobacillus otakiensis]|uniref:prephenate dehydrogenase n=1 Tax=Lentilactobacillus otakiensis TaxID=481720 RepID=UPI003D17EC41